MTQDNCTCTTIVELRQPADINAEIDHLYALLALRLERAGCGTEATELVFLAMDFGRPNPARKTPATVAAPAASAVAG